MTSFLKKNILGHIIWDLYIAKRKNLFLQYLKLIIKDTLNNILRLNIQNETFLGYKFRFYNYKSFAFLIKDVFIHSPYKTQITKMAPLIIDCGGNIGISVIFFKHLYPHAKIIVFEPNKSSFNLLTKNIEDNKLSNVTIINKAISRKRGKVEFYDTPDKASSNASLINWQIKSDLTFVESVLLSDFIKEHIDLLKLDIEGAEGQVIEDLHKTNKLKMVNEVICEYHHNISPESTLSTFLDLFEKSGFNYQISAFQRPPLEKTSQNLLIYFYKN